MPENAFGWVPTPALVAPIEFTMGRDDYKALGGHSGAVVRLHEVLTGERIQRRAWDDGNPRPFQPEGAR